MKNSFTMRKRVLHLVFLAFGVLFAGSLLGLWALQPGTGYAGEPPKGYSSIELIKLAVLTKQLPLADREIPVPETIEVKKGIEYGHGGDVSLKLDMYSPKKNNGRVPGLIFIHGGGWKKGSREDYQSYCVKFAEMGYVVTTISYRLRQVAPYPAAIEDTKCAVRWMRENAQQINVDPNRIAAIGGSAGAYLAMMAGYSSDVPEFEGQGGHGKISSQVQAVVNLYGPVDLTTEYARKHELVTGFLEKSYEQDQEIFRQASPLTYVSRNDPPTLILHGTIDDLVPITQADKLAEAMKRLNVPVQYEKLKGWPHGMDMAQVVNDYCVLKIHSFLQTYLESQK